MFTDEMIRNLESKGFKRWTKGNYDRLYINAEKLGLSCDYYKTGNISSAEFKGEWISNSRARAYKAAKTFVDIASGKVFSDIEALKAAAEELIEKEG